MLGVSVTPLRLCILLLSTLAVAAVVSLSGLISFVGLLAPHGARLLTKNNKLGTALLSGLLGGVILCELPISICTSLLGAPLLIILIVRGRKQI